MALREATLKEILFCLHKWKENPDYDDDWGGVILAEQCQKCGLIRQTCHKPNYNKYYYMQKEDETL